MAEEAVEEIEEVQAEETEVEETEETVAAEESEQDETASKASASKGKKQEGVVKWFDPMKNYGFIGREGEDDVFVHRNDLGGVRVVEGDKVSFNVEKGDKGPVAVNVEKV